MITLAELIKKAEEEGIRVEVIADYSKGTIQINSHDPEGKDRGKFVNNIINDALMASDVEITYEDGANAPVDQAITGIPKRPNPFDFVIKKVPKQKTLSIQNVPEE